MGLIRPGSYHEGRMHGKVINKDLDIGKYKYKMAGVFIYWRMRSGDHYERGESDSSINQSMLLLKGPLYYPSTSRIL